MAAKMLRKFTLVYLHVRALLAVAAQRQIRSHNLVRELSL
jgi:hypothetical protein